MIYDELCPGCGHRIAMNLIEKVIEEKKIAEKTIIALDVACCSLFIDKLPYDSIMCAHGRVLPASKGIKNIKEDSIVVSYMGDGAGYSIGLNETVSSALRNDNVLMIVINNMLFSMTGGQASPTTLSGIKTITTPYGKDKIKYGDALKIEDVISKFNISYLARAALTNKDTINDAYKYINIAFENYIKNGGFNMVELISPCPTNNHMKPKDIYKYIDDEILKYYKLGEFVC